MGNHIHASINQLGGAYFAGFDLILCSIFLEDSPYGVSWSFVRLLTAAITAKVSPRDKRYQSMS